MHDYLFPLYSPEGNNLCTCDDPITQKTSVLKRRPPLRLALAGARIPVAVIVLVDPIDHGSADALGAFAELLSQTVSLSNHQRRSLG